jgi:hypothetical protein
MSESERIREHGNQLRAEQDRKRMEAEEQKLRDLERENLSEEELQRKRNEIRSRIEVEREAAERARQEVLF